ncbi:PhzF family phenazine biosynthesis protein [Luteimonas sp. MJ246]|uniref:PhzF family phenazine biosynthesis protein n=1 Tax=Luteimonas sp. MJ174 TaxID=3129237 RepID=UPI0031BB5FB7
MTARPYVQLDVFSDRAGAGNPLAVIPDAGDINDATMQAIARWTRLPETTFVFPSPTASADYAVRIFSPRREVPFAGHPSVGTAHVLLDRGLVTPRDGILVQSCAVGELPLRVDGEGASRTVAVRTPRASVVEVAGADDPRLRDALAGLVTGALPPVLMDGGRRWWLAELRDEAELRSATPDWAAITALAEATGTMGLCAFARSEDPVYYLAVRAWVGSPAPFEDAASGAANATLAAWLAERDALPGEDGFYRISQGREVGHDAIIELRVDAEGEVWSGGRARSIVSGSIDW